MTDVIATLRRGLADRYSIARELGAGGMATVYLATDLRHGRDVAIKVLHPDLGAALGGERFLAEIRTTARLQHPHILPLLDSGEAESLLFYVMPYIAGETLRTRLEREQQLPIDDAIRIAREVADAVGAAHALGIIHRDIKPENILLQGGHALVADFGIALAVQSAGGQRMTQTGLSLGTPQYMSPEQAMGEKTVDVRSDIYALGAVTYEMLAGEPPFTGPSVQAIVARIMTEQPRSLVVQRRSIPEHVEAAVLRSLEKLPADRFASAAEFATALTQTNGGTRVTRRVGARSGAATIDRWKPMAMVLAVVTIACASVAAWTLLHNKPTAGPTVFDAALPDSTAMVVGIMATSTGFAGLTVNMDIAPRGDLVVYAATRGDSTTLWVRNLVDATARAIAGTGAAVGPHFSPDGTRIAYFAGNRVMIVPVSGGEPRSLGTIDDPQTLMWVSLTRILVTSDQGYLLTSIDPEVGLGDSRKITRCPRSTWLADENRLLCSFNERGFVVDPVGGQRWDIRSRTTDGSPGTALSGSGFQVVDHRYLIYVSLDGQVRAALWDPKTRLAGRSVTLVTGVHREGTGQVQYVIAANGTLGFAPGTGLVGGPLVQLHRNGAPTPLPIAPAAFQRVDLRRDRRMLAAVVTMPNEQELRIYDLRSGQFTVWLRAALIRNPLWQPGGTRLLARIQDSLGSAIVIGDPALATAPDTIARAIAPASVPDPMDFADEHTVYASNLGNDGMYRFDPTARNARIDTLASDGGVFVQRSPDQRFLVYQNSSLATLKLTNNPPTGMQKQVAGGAVEPLWLSSTELLYRSGVSWWVVTIDGATGDVVGTPTLWARDPRFTDTSGWSNRPTWDGGIIYLQDPSPREVRSLRFMPNWVRRMEAAVDSANR